MFALMFVIFAFAVQANAQVLNEILNRVEAHRKSLDSLRADIKMGKYNPDLSEWNYSNGKVLLAAKTNNIKDALLRIDWKDPREETLVIANGRYIAYTPALKVYYTGEASAKKAEQDGGSAFSFLSMSKAQLNANYTPGLAGQETLEGGPATWHLTFSPKTKAKYKNADIWVDQNGMILQVKIVQNSGDESFIRLTNLEKNPNLTIQLFKVNLQGAKEIKS